MKIERVGKWCQMSRFDTITCIGLADSKDQKIGSGNLVPQNPNLVIMQLSTPLNKGVYQVHWKVLSRHGHTTKGSYSFSVK